MWCKHTIVSYEKSWLNTKHHYKSVLHLCTQVHVQYISDAT